MKIRSAFVANSSSSSFVILSLGDVTILVDGDTSMECCGGDSIDLNELERQIKLARERGVTRLDISHGGGYDG
jgi:hypothetical protein